MKVPIQVSFKNMDHSDAIEELVNKHAAKLDQNFDKITSCRVVIEEPHKRHTKGNLYQVKLDITLPGDEIIIKKEANDRGNSDDIQIALKDAFEVASRMLQEYANKKRGYVKRHANNEDGGDEAEDKEESGEIEVVGDVEVAT